MVPHIRNSLTFELWQIQTQVSSRVQNLVLKKVYLVHE